MQEFLHNLSVLLATSAQNLGFYKYLILVILALFEGPMTMVFSGFLVRLGILNPVLAYFFLIFGDLIGDFAWYSLGYFGGKGIILKVGKYVSLSEEIVDRIAVKFRQHQGKIIFISKITMGFGFALATLITAGVIHISPKKFGIFNLLGGLVWTSSLMFIGFTLGHAYLSVQGGFKLVYIVAIAITLLLLIVGFQRFVRDRFMKNKISL